jgi:hypothetical protein
MQQKAARQLFTRLQSTVGPRATPRNFVVIVNDNDDAVVSRRFAITHDFNFCMRKQPLQCTGKVLGGEWIYFSRGDFNTDFKVRTACWNIQTLHAGWAKLTLKGPPCQRMVANVYVPPCLAMVEQMKVGNGSSTFTCVVQNKKKPKRNGANATKQAGRKRKG